MSRYILAEDKIHPAVREQVSGYHCTLVEQVQAVVARDQVVVVGMGLNPFPRKARKLLDAQGIAYTYLSYGNYFNTWRPRIALKMWTGWSTFPMVFVNGILIGGANDLQKLIERGELARMLAS